MHGNRRPHSFLWKTEVPFFGSVNVTDAVLFLAHTRHGITRVAPAEADVAVKAPVTLTRLQEETRKQMNVWIQANKEYKQQPTWG